MKGLIFFGVIIFIGSIVLFVKNLYLWEIDKKGKVVLMELIKLPRNCPAGNKGSYYVTFKYQDKLFDMQTGGGFCRNHKKGELIPIKYLEGQSRILRENESALMHLISILGIGLFGLFCSVYHWRKYYKK